MNSFMSLILRIIALIIFVMCLSGHLQETSMTTTVIAGWSILICANLEDIKEILKYDRNTKYDCNWDRGSD